MSPVLVLRTFWRLVSAGMGVIVITWIVANRTAVGLGEDLGHFIPTLISLAVITGGFYLLAFRFSDAYVQNLSLFLGTALVLFLVGELGIRIWDRVDPIFRPSHLEDNIPYQRSRFSIYEPGATGWTHGQLVRINNLGFRGPKYPVIKLSDTFRIIVLGDSFTFGQGIGEDEVYTSLLQKALIEKFPRRTIEVMNLGVGGYSAIDEMRLLEKIGPLLQPDVVLIGFTGNDVREGNQVPEEERNRWTLPFPERLKSFAIGHSKLLSWITIKYDELLITLGLRPTYFSSVLAAYEPDSGEWKRFVAAYQRMVEWTKARRIPPPLVGLFITTPYWDPRKNDFVNMTTPYLRIQEQHIRQVEAALNSMGAATVDFLPLFQRYNRQNLLVSKWEGHPGPLAHRLYAEGFLEALLRLNLIERLQMTSPVSHSISG